MAMFNYGVGGQEVPQDASEAMMDLDQNRTMFIQKLTTTEDPRTEAVYDLKNVQEVFDHFKPNVDVDFQTADGQEKNENLRFKNVGDFSSNSITQQSSFLQDLQNQKEQYQKIAKQLKTNKVMKNVIENQEYRSAFISSLQALIQELEETK